jgi:hypothetical protein
MRVTQHDGGPARRILTSMIVDSRLLAKVSNRWEGRGLFESEWENLIGSWCVGFYKKYGRAPHRAVEGLFERWADGRRNTEVVNALRNFLNDLSGSYTRQAKKSDPEFTADLAASHFTAVRIRRRLAEAEALVEEDRPDEAASLFSDGKVDFPSGGYIDFYRDRHVWKEELTKDAIKPLVKYRHGAGVFFKDAFARESFIAVEAVEKGGKSFCLQDIVWRAVRQGRRTAWFQCGDLSRRDTLERLGVRATGTPYEPCTVRIPVTLEPPAHEHEKVKVTYRTEVFKKGLTYKEADKAVFRELKRREPHDRFRLEVFPTRGVSVLGIQSALDEYARTGWSADVVVVDYADILAPVSGTADTRDQINTTWELLRGMAIRSKCLVVTATQVKRTAYNTDIILPEDTAEDKRKNGHVTGKFSINRTEDEVEQGLYRLNWNFLRRRRFSRRTCLIAAGALEIGNPFILSVF